MALGNNDDINGIYMCIFYNPLCSFFVALNQIILILKSSKIFIVIKKIKIGMVF